MRIGLREKGKARRRSEVLSAASTLWRLQGVTHVTLAQIADAAEVSAQTIYNLIGGVDELKIAVVEALLDRLDEAVEGSEERGVARSIQRALMSARLFAADPGLYRQVLVGIPQAVFDGARLSRDGSDFQRTALIEAQGLGELRPDTDILALAGQIHLQYLGGLFSWACGALNEAQFIRATELGVLSILAVGAEEPIRSNLARRIERLVAVKRPALVAVDGG